MLDFFVCVRVYAFVYFTVDHGSLKTTKAVLVGKKRNDGGSVEQLSSTSIILFCVFVQEKRRIATSG